MFDKYENQKYLNRMSEPSQKEKMVEIAAFWRRTSKNGKRYLAGTMKTEDIPETFGEKVKVIMFDNKSKEKENQPDFYLYLSNNNQLQAAKVAGDSLSEEEGQNTEQSQDRETATSNHSQSSEDIL